MTSARLCHYHRRWLNKLLRDCMCNSSWLRYQAVSFSTTGLSRLQLKESHANQNGQGGSFLEKVIEQRSHVPTTTVEKIKQKGRDVTYGGIILFGLGITGALFYAIFRELFSSRSPNGVYHKTVKIIKSNHQVLDALGEPIKAYGEENRRGRRRHTQHIEYKVDGLTYMRMKFYVEGSRRKGTVMLEMKEDQNGNFDYRYLIVELDGLIPETFVLKDNR